jgi:hypothetical protein
MAVDSGCAIYKGSRLVSAINPSNWRFSWARMENQEQKLKDYCVKLREIEDSHDK